MTIENRLARLEKRILPLRSALLNHSIYEQIESIEHLRCFMESHVFAVWDFMSLLKSLQLQLCPPHVPWTPPMSPPAARFVNEIVLGEECDDDVDGGYASHFEQYRRAMQKCGAKMACIDGFIADLEAGLSLEVALSNCNAPRAVRQFVLQTFDFIRGGDVCAIGSAFTFGREDLLPDVFRRMIDQLTIQAPGELREFQYYLNRHVEVDGDHHGPLAQQMMMELCQRDDAKWHIAEEAATRALQTRLRLWDEIRLSIGMRKSSAPVVAASNG